VPVAEPDGSDRIQALKRAGDVFSVNKNYPWHSVDIIQRSRINAASNDNLKNFVHLLKYTNTQ
jgi:hypothetical protein